MSKAILLSKRSQYVSDILNGRKTIEIRNKFPTDFIGWVYICVTKKGNLYRFRTTNKDKYIYHNDIVGERLNGKVVARFWCDKVEYVDSHWDRPGETFYYDTISLKEQELLEKSCITYNELDDYIFNSSKDYAYAIYITKLEIFDEPKELKEFYKLDNSYDNMFGWCADEDEKKVYLTKAPQNYCYIEVEE